jgi:hypothetical protein
MFSLTKMRLAAAGVFLTTAALVFAQTAYERELSQLKDQREQSKATVVEPIERRYQAALEQLLRRATQAGDLEGAIKVKEELEKFPSSSDPRNTPLELIGVWELFDPINNARLTREFKPNGKMISDGPPGGKWTISNANKLVLNYNDPQLVDTFELPIKNHQMNGMSKSKHPLTLTKVLPK